MILCNKTNNFCFRKWFGDGGLVAVLVVTDWWS
jgi:hypothetical protein